MTAVHEPEAAERAPLIIDTPGVYDDIPEAAYHADPVPTGSLSVSGAKVLLDAPARFAYQRQHGRPPKKAFDFGHVVHHFVLGRGAEIVEVHADDWRTKAAKEARQQAYADGKVPILTDDYRRAKAAAAAVRAHPMASALFNVDLGKPEQSIFWVDPETGVWLRGRTDWMQPLLSGHLAVVDLKTCKSAKPWHINKAMAEYSYDQQDPWYRAGITAIGLDEAPGFVFVFVEIEPPHIVTVGQLDEPSRQTGHARNRRAIELYAECAAADHWPGYVPDDQIVDFSTPSYRTADS